MIFPYPYKHHQVSLLKNNLNLILLLFSIMYLDAHLCGILIMLQFYTDIFFQYHLCFHLYDLSNRDAYYKIRLYSFLKSVLKDVPKMHYLFQNQILYNEYQNPLKTGHTKLMSCL